MAVNCPMSRSSRLVRVTYLIALVFAALANAANIDPVKPLPPISAAEKAQGYRNGIVLAKPRLAFRALIDATESTEGVRVRQKFERLDDLRMIELSSGEQVQRAIKRLQATGRYEFVEPDYIIRPDARPTDPSFSLQWGLENTGQFSGYTVGADIHAVAAWDVIHDSPNVIIALVDGGVRVDHQDIAANLWQNPSPTFGDIHGASFLNGVRGTDINDADGHGTHVAGIICAAANNGVGTAGVTWRAQLMVVRNIAADGTTTTSDSATSIDYAVTHGANVINCSWGTPSFSQTLLTSIKKARDAGIIVVCSAGNDGTNNDTISHYPSNYLADNIVAVGNSMGNDTASSTSNYGALVDLFAPGTSIRSSDYSTTTGIVSFSGTSMAAPHVTGAIALLKAQFPNDTCQQLINRLLRSADVKVALAGQAVTNARLNLFKAVTSTSNKPFNDDFISRAVITGTKVTLRANNSGATVEAGEITHAVGATGSLWWQWVAPAGGLVTVDTFGSDYDTAVEVFSYSSGATAGNLSSITLNDDDGLLKTSRTTFTATAATSYIICVGGKNGAQGFTQLNVTMSAPNDNFTSAQLLTGVSTQASGNNVSATTEPAEPRIAGFTGVGSMWYKWVAPKSGRFQISSYSADFDSLLGVYTGTDLTNLTLVASSDDTDPDNVALNWDSRCTIDATSGTTYYFLVKSAYSPLRGTFVISVTDSLWQFSTGGVVSGSPAVASDGTVYIPASGPDYRLYALTSDGTIKWTYAATGSLLVTTPALGSDGTVYQESGDGTVVALTATGSVRWKQKLGATTNIVTGSIAIATDGTLYVRGNDGYLYALNPADGSTRWRYNVNALTYGSATIGSDGTIYQGSDGDSCIYAINPDGTLKWKYATGSSTYTTPALDASGNIYFATYANSQVLSLTPNGTLRWTYNGVVPTNAISGSPALSADGTTVYIGAADSNLYALESATGSVRWAYACGDWIFASTPAVDANGVIYIGSYDQKLYAINPNGTLKRTWDMGEVIRSSPVISGTRLYVGSNDYKLYAFDIGATLANGPWPQYRQNSSRNGRVPISALAITVAPQSQSYKTGDTISLSVTATGQNPITYQWKKDGAAINGATGASYIISGASATAAGAYTVTVTTPQGSVTSSAANLTFNAPGTGPTAWLSNLSVRAAMVAGQTLIVGLNVSGGTKDILVRGAGPSLADYGVTSAMADPKLQLYSGQTPILVNDDWDSGLATTFTSAGAFPFKISSKDAAFVRSLNGGYSVQATGTTAGTLLVEAYALGSGNSPRLTNVSARNQVGTGDDILIAGFAVAGTGTKKVLIRAVGPRLADFGVTGYLLDPKLEVYNSANTKIAENDTWTASLADTFSAVGAFSLIAGSKDAAVIVELTAGSSYSIQVKGADGGTGEALVEVYEVP